MNGPLSLAVLLIVSGLMAGSFFIAKDMYEEEDKKERGSSTLRADSVVKRVEKSSDKLNQCKLDLQSVRKDFENYKNREAKNLPWFTDTDEQNVKLSQEKLQLEDKLRACENKKPEVKIVKEKCSWF